jgi:hypothetical protein
MTDKSDGTRLVFARRRVYPGMALVTLFAMSSFLIYTGNIVSPIDSEGGSYYAQSLTWHMAVSLIALAMVGLPIWEIFKQFHTRISACGVEQPQFLRDPLSFHWEDVDQISFGSSRLYFHVEGKRVLLALAYFRHPEQVLDHIHGFLDATRLHAEDNGNSSSSG